MSNVLHVTAGSLLTSYLQDIIDIFADLLNADPVLSVLTHVLFEFEEGCYLPLHELIDIYDMCQSCHEVS